MLLVNDRLTREAIAAARAAFTTLITSAKLNASIRKLGLTMFSLVSRPGDHADRGSAFVKLDEAGNLM